MQVGILGRIAAAGRRPGQCVDRRDDRGGRAGAAELMPAAADPVGVVDGDAGAGVGVRGDVVLGPVQAAVRRGRVRQLPGRLGLQGGAARTCPLRAGRGSRAPHFLGPAASGARVPQRGAPDGGHVL